MRTLIQTWQPAIQQQMTKIVGEFAESSHFILDTVLLEYTTQLSQKGKQFRGCLLAGFYSAHSNSLSEAEAAVAARLAAAIELHGTAILIHDDIIDKSSKRRGLDTAHVFARALAHKHRLSEPDHFGVSAAICLADFLFFAADQAVAQLDIPAEIRVELAAINGRELALLGLAEIEDLRLSSTSSVVSKEDTLQMFVGKTGRYTGRWPLELAAVMAGLSTELQHQVAVLGEKIGLLYQLKDDELGLFGDEAVTGKSSSSDITEGKKTLYYWYLQQLEGREKERVFAVLGNPSATAEQITWLKSYIEESSIRQTVATEVADLAATVSKEVVTTGVSAQAQAVLLEVLEFVVQRDK